MSDISTGITVADLQKELPPQDYRTVTLGDSSIAETCLTRAAIWVRGKVLSTGRPYDATDEVVQECVLKRAVYELFSFVGNESRAKMKLRDLEDLMESYFGAIAKVTESDTTSSGPSAGRITKAKVPRYGR